MRRIVALLSAVLMLAAVTAVAQEKMKDSPKSGHEGMAKAGGAKSAAVIAKTTSAAPPDIGRNAAVMGMGPDGKMKELRAGTNGWMCMLDLAGDSIGRPTPTRGPNKGTTIFDMKHLDGVAVLGRMFAEIMEDCRAG